ncbi:MAG TPA: GIY-YIG nuclease family protein [Allosphingosinicella sp.]|nr:GIY-YIG nuclease family protein [Allosphingosinicella sp.]
MSAEMDRLIKEVLDLGWEGRSTAFGPCEGYVYFVVTAGSQDKHVKIGFSKSDPRRRMAALQTGNHKHLRILGFLPGCRRMEAALHVQLAPHRASGEWFRAPSDLFSIIEQHIIDHGLASNDPENFCVGDG